MNRNGTNDARSDLPDFEKLWDYNDPAGTGEMFREILPAARESGDRAYLAELLTQIARTQGLQREFDAAHATLDDVEDLLIDDASVPRIRYLLERGRVFNSSIQQDKARALFLLAWDLGRQTGADRYSVDAAHMLGIVDSGEASLAWTEKAISLAERSADPKANAWLGSLYNNTAWTCHEMGRFEQALALHEKNLAWQTQRENGEMISVAQWCIARTLRSLGRIEEALARQRELLKQHEAAGTKDGYVCEELAECLWSLNRKDEARPFFARAHALLSKDPWLAANEPQRLERLKQLAAE